MQEIVPPKLNRDTGLLSFLINRRNIIIGIGFTMSFFVWTSFKNLTTDEKIVIEIIIGFLLIPLLFDVYGRPFHLFVIDLLKHFFSFKKQRTILAKDISEGILINGDGTYAQIFEIQPVNLSMSSEEEVSAFKSYLQSALFALKNPIQIITIQQYSSNDENLSIETERANKLTGKLQQRAKEYLEDYKMLTQTMERKFYLVITTHAKNLEDARNKFSDQITFLKLLEQTRVGLVLVDSEEVLNITNKILTKQ